MKMNMMMMMKNKKVIDCLWWRRWWSCWRGGGWLSLHFFTKSRMEFYPNGCAATKKDFTPSIGSAKTWSETKPEISPGFRVNVFVLGFKCAWKTLESVPFCLGNWICWFYGFDFCWWVSIRFHGLSLWLCVCVLWLTDSQPFHLWWEDSIHFWFWWKRHMSCNIIFYCAAFQKSNLDDRSPIHDVSGMANISSDQFIPGSAYVGIRTTTKLCICIYYIWGLCHK